ncbi:MAG: glycosyltransferase 87 family protein [Allosphingosinicella sp.]|uniref:glycosyltransferase 87 family protein n=1 Tax=Allosphingosinicella sp. TaxID=2823234 RepID=UPI00394CD737
MDGLWKRWALPGAVTGAALIAAYVAWYFKAHCLFDGGWQAAEQYVTGCYTDMSPFWAGRGVAEGRLPYLEARIEYPVLTGFLIWAQGLITRLLFGQAAGELAFLTVGTALNAGLLLVTAAALMRSGVPRRRLMWLVLGPTTILYLGHNWDFLAVALMALGLHFHLAGRPGRAGAMLGLGAAAKLFPIFLLPLLVFDHLGRRDWRGLALVGGAAVAAWAAVNLPVALAAPERWAEFYTFSRERHGTFAATWSLLGQIGIPSSTETRNLWGFLLFAGGAAALTLAARRRFEGRMWMLSAPVLALFLLTNKVYSPQFDLWLVPLLLLASPRLWPVAALMGANLIVYWMEFWLFAGQAGAAVSASEAMLAAAGWLRLAVLAAIVAAPFAASGTPLAPGAPETRVPPRPLQEGQNA